MYAQHRRQADGMSAVPRNYSGNAFRYPPPTPLSPPVREAASAESEVSDIPIKVADGKADEAEVVQAEERQEDSARSEQDREGHSLLSGLLPHGIGNEELLLLGLLFLLSGEKDNARQDLPIYLLLLLFCG